MGSGTLDPTKTFSINIVKSSTTAFGDVAASATEIIDLGEAHVFNNLKIVNTLNQPVRVTFPGDETQDTLDLAAAEDIDPFIPFKHNGSIKLHYTGSAPTSGDFITKHT